MSLQKFKDDLAKDLFGQTKTEADKKNVCLFCKKPVTGFNDELSEKDYKITGMCQECQDGFYE